MEGVAHSRSHGHREGGAITRHRVWIAAAIIAALCWAITATYFADWYYAELRHCSTELADVKAEYEGLKAEYEGLRGEYEGLERTLEDLAIRINICIDYGNGTRTWHNSTLVPEGSSLLHVMERVADVEYRADEEGLMIVSINGVRNSKTRAYCWVWWHWDDKLLKWVHMPIAPDRYTPPPGDIVCWYYEYVFEYPFEPPATSA